MAAGLGTRLRPFTEVLPKPLLPLMGKPMIQYPLMQLQDAGVEEVFVNFHHHPQIFKSEMDEIQRLLTARTILSDESQMLLGSAGGLGKVKSQIGQSSFFLMNADVFQTIDLSLLTQKHLELKNKHGVWMTLALIPPQKRSAPYREIVLDQTTGLIQKLGQQSFDQAYYSGVAVLEPESISKISENQVSDFVTEILQPAVLAKKVGYYLSHSVDWLDIGSPQLWWEAHLQLLSHLNQNGPYLNWIGKPGAVIPPFRLGQRAVLYADESTSLDRVYESGIGFRDIWVGFDSKGTK